MEYLHDALRIPEDGVGVEIEGRIEPEEELLLPFALSLGEDVRVERVGLAARIPQKFEVDFVVVVPLR